MGVDTLHGAIGNIFWFFGDVAFTWVPATIGAITGTAPGASPPFSLISQPVTASDVVAYMRQYAPPPEYADLVRHWGELVAIALVVSLLLAALMAYCIFRILEIRRHERERFQVAAHPVAAHDISRTQLHWNRVVEESMSNDEKRWRLAILEADIMLNELLDLNGYRGETMADKMKQVDRANFHTIDLAWEAHRVRNSIAHEGSARLLNEREVRRVIGLYEQVFREFKLVS
ncbi:MAG TPA: hypothetical protein VMH91_01900 [Candidatus Paceibacterota bacterium]|nr:hypothetical protein [Candidatus Paceibacterota bacterium]